jgi:hypothetical protein
MDRSCAATIYPVLDKPCSTEIRGRRGLELQEICPPIFQVPFTIGLGDR